MTASPGLTVSALLHQDLVPFGGVTGLCIALFDCLEVLSVLGLPFPDRLASALIRFGLFLKEPRPVHWFAFLGRLRSPGSLAGIATQAGTSIRVEGLAALDTDDWSGGDVPVPVALTVGDFQMTHSAECFEVSRVVRQANPVWNDVVDIERPSVLLGRQAALDADLIPYPDFASNFGPFWSALEFPTAPTRVVLTSAPSSVMSKVQEVDRTDSSPCEIGWNTERNGASTRADDFDVWTHSSLGDFRFRSVRMLATSEATHAHILHKSGSLNREKAGYTKTDATRIVRLATTEAEVAMQRQQQMMGEQEQPGEEEDV